MPIVFFYTKNSLISFLKQVSPDFIAFPSRYYCFPVPIFTSLSSSPPKVSPGFYSSPVSIIFYLSFSPRLRFLFYSILTLSLSLRFFTCDSFSPPAISLPPPAISFTYCRFKQSPCPKFLQHSSVFTLSTPVLISQSDLFSTPLNEVLHEKISKTRKIPRK